MILKINLAFRMMRSIQGDQYSAINLFCLDILISIIEEGKTDCFSRTEERLFWYLHIGS